MSYYLNFLCRSVRNEQNTCYLSCFIQALVAMDKFCRKAEGEPFSPITSKFMDIVKAMDKANRKALDQATRAFRLFLASEIHPDYLDETEQRDCQELFQRTLQAIDEEIDSLRAQMGLPFEENIIKSTFNSTLELSTTCSRYASFLILRCPLNLWAIY